MSKVFLQEQTLPAFSWRSRGDVMNAVLFINSLVYLSIFLLAKSGVTALVTMDERTRIDGFCVTNPEDPYLNSHMLSFYIDVVFSIISLEVVHSTPAGYPSCDLLERSIPGSLGHGIGHLFVSATGSMGILSLPLPLYMKLAAPLTNFFFWWSLLRKNKYIPKSHLLAMALVHSVVTLSPFLPSSTVFVYVQTVLVLTFSVYEVFFRPREEKDIAYNWRWVISAPSSVVAWVEAMACTSFLRDIGGHVWFDASIQLTTLLYYFFVRGLEKPKKVKE